MTDPRRAIVWVMLWVLATGAAAAVGRIPAPPWFEQAYWDQVVFGCAEQPDLCQPNNPNGRTVPTTDRVSTMDVHLDSAPAFPTATLLLAALIMVAMRRIATARRR